MDLDVDASGTVSSSDPSVPQSGFLLESTNHFLHRVVAQSRRSGEEIMMIQSHTRSRLERRPRALPT